MNPKVDKPVKIILQSKIVLRIHTHKTQNIPKRLSLAPLRGFDSNSVAWYTIIDNTTSTVCNVKTLIKCPERSALNVVIRKMTRVQIKQNQKIKLKFFIL